MDEGIRKSDIGYDSDFSIDNIGDVISLVSPAIYQSSTGDNIYWFGYKLNSNVGRQERKAFLDWIKGLSDNQPTDREYEQIISRPINDLYKKINVI